jgi:predicted nucleotidyltransferase
MVTREKIDAAIQLLARAADPARIVLFGSYARGDVGEDSDFDLPVSELVVDLALREGEVVHG